MFSNYQVFQKDPSQLFTDILTLPFPYLGLVLPFFVSSRGTVSLGLVNETEKTNCFRYSQIKHCSWVIYLLLFRASLISEAEI